MSLTNANCSAAKRSSPTIRRWGRQQVKNLGCPRSVLGRPLPRNCVRELNSANGSRQTQCDCRQPAVNMLDGKIFEDRTNPGRADGGGRQQRDADLPDQTDIIEHTYPHAA